jgi:small-conductance mechanosensitive channel
MKKAILLISALFIVQSIFAKTTIAKQDSLRNDSLQVAQKMLAQQQQQQYLDSIIKAKLEIELENASGNRAKQNELTAKLAEIATNDSIRNAALLNKINQLKASGSGYPVILDADTLFIIYTKIGSFKPSDRANAISVRVRQLYNNPFFSPDTLEIVPNEESVDIIYQDQLIMSVNNLDAMWVDESKDELAKNLRLKIINTIAKVKEQNSTTNWIKRLGLVFLIIVGVWLIIKGINFLFAKTKSWILKNKDKYFNGISFRTSKLLSDTQQLNLTFQFNNALRLLTIGLAIYLSLPLLFSLFPETEKWTSTLLNWILAPAKSIFNGFLNYLPNLFTIAVIYIFTSYTVKGVAYFTKEIIRGNIQLSGFHPDWAMPTFNIMRFLLYAFMLVVMFPYLPGSDSAAFQGVSVFIGILLSFGSSSAITNIVAGLVITYMRPFKVGDRVKIGEVVGDVVEKTMLVTRIKTIKNEDITVPNATVLSSHTINYSSNAPDSGLIMHTTVTIGYDVPWKKIHEALLNAANRTTLVLKDPKPFVLQTSLDDFYVAYQINVYTQEPNKQATIYSELHQHIQDCCNEMDIEILSPHYRAMRDGNMITIPADYLAKDYVAPTFNVNVSK